MGLMCNKNLLILTMASFCLILRTSATEETNLNIPALERKARLGYLYDERTDKFSDFSVFSKEIPQKCINHLNEHNNILTETGASNTFMEKMQLLEIDERAGVNILLGISKVRGSSSILKGGKQSSLVQEASLIRTYATGEETIDIFNRELLEIFNRNFLHHREATHIVTSISWGARLCIALQTRITPKADAEGLGEAFEAEFQKIERILVQNKEDCGKYNFTLKMQSDIPIPTSAQATVQDAQNTLESMEKLINDTNGGKGIPLEFGLTPIRDIRNFLRVSPIHKIVVRNIKDSTLRKIIKLFADVSDSHLRLNQVFEETRLRLNCIASNTRDEIGDMRTELIEYKEAVTAILKATLQDVRSDIQPATKLLEIVQRHQQSNYSLSVVKRRLAKYDQEIRKVALCHLLHTSYSGIEYFGSRFDLISRISQVSGEFKVYILLTKNEFRENDPATFAENLNIFLQILYPAELLNKLFLVDCDFPHDFCNNVTNTEIYEFKNGTMELTDFRNKSEMEESDLQKRIGILQDQIENQFNRSEAADRRLIELEAKLNEKPDDSCQSSPCQNNGQCLTKNNSFRCACLLGFTGATCQVNVNECESSETPCENGGRCIDEIGGFTCVCPPSFAGRKCHAKLDPCNMNECQNGGSCIPSSNYLEFRCECSIGFSGALCEINNDDCAGSPICENGGTCFDGINGYTCACVEGYEGRHCSIVTNYCAEKDPCLNGGTCQHESSGYSCACADEYAGRRCEHENHCIYSWTCNASNSSAKCHVCTDGYVKDPKTNNTCKPAEVTAYFIISSVEDIKKVSVEGRSNATQVIHDGSNVRGIDSNSRTKAMVWFSADDHTIYAGSIQTSGEPTVIAHDNKSHVYGLALDWVHNLVYWTDAGRKEICVSNLNGTMKKVLVQDGLLRPTSIAINPLNGWMHWVDFSKNEIERAGLDGLDREIILSTNSTKLWALTIDFVDNRIFWTQYNPESIASSDFDGSNRKLILLSKNPHSQDLSNNNWFRSLTIFENDIYWLDWKNKTIYSINKCGATGTGEDIVPVYKSESHIWDVKVVDASRQPIAPNLCDQRIEKCSHFCLRVPFVSSADRNATVCACPNHLRLGADNLNCA